MPRARNIKPGFFTNDALAECEPLARLLFAGLWTIADREGRLEDRPKKIKAELLPYDDCDANPLLQQLFTHGFIIRYTVDNISYIQVLNFAKHQNCHMKEGESNIPAPDKHQTSAVQVGEILAPARPLTESFLLNPESTTDSPILIPDSPNPVFPPAEVIDTEFIQFRNLYPLQGRDFGSVKEAVAKFKVARKKDSFDKIIQGVQRYANYITNTGQSSQDAFRWLEKERWRESYIVSSKPANDKHLRTLEAAARGHAKAANPDF